MPESLNLGTDGEWLKSYQADIDRRVAVTTRLSGFTQVGDRPLNPVPRQTTHSQNTILTARENHLNGSQHYK